MAQVLLRVHFDCAQCDIETSLHIYLDCASTESMLSIVEVLNLTRKPSWASTAPVLSAVEVLSVTLRLFDYRLYFSSLFTLKQQPLCTPRKRILPFKWQFGLVMRHSFLP